ncbi:unnamed protein product [Ectocarpus sp. 12 AP-2014]
MQLELEHLQRQHKWRVLLSDAEHLLSRPINTNLAQDDSNIGLLPSATPRLHRGLTLAQQQPHPQHQQQHQEEEQQRQRDSAANLAWKLLFFQHQEQPRSRSPSPPLLATQCDPGLCVVGESITSASSPTRGASPSPSGALSSLKRMETSGRMTPPLANEGGADAKPVDRGRMPQPQDKCRPSPETADGPVVRREDNPQQPPICQTTSSSFSDSSPNIYPSDNGSSSSTGEPPTQGNPPPNGGSSSTLTFEDEEINALEKPSRISNEGASVSFSVSPEAPAATAATAAAAFTPQPNEGRQSHSEGSGSGGGWPILGKTSSSTSPLLSIPIPTAIAAGSPQPGITKRNDNMVGTGPDPVSYEEKQGVHRGRQRGQNHQSQTERNNCQSPFGAGAGAGAGTGTSANTLETATEPASFQSVMLATEWMETEWKPLAVSRGSTRPVVQIVSYNRPSTTVTGLQPIHPLPVFSDGNETPLRMVGAKISRDGATPANAAATIATTDHTPSSPSAGRLQGGIVSGPTWGGGGAGRGGAERGLGGEGVSSPTPTLFSFPNNHADGKDSENPFLLTTSGSGTCRIGVHSGNGRRPKGRRERGRRQSAVRTGKSDATIVVEEEDVGDKREQSGRYSQSPPTSPTAWTPPTGTRSLFSGGEV